MSKWKDSKVSIIQVFIDSLYTHGLGDDSKLYIWKWQQGAWEKDWNYKDEPSE